MSGIIRRKVDSKGRVVLPFKDVREVLIVKSGDVIIASPKRSEIERILRIIEEYNKREKLKIAEDWFRLVEEAGLSEIEESKIQEILKKGMLREVV